MGLFFPRDAVGPSAFTRFTVPLAIRPQIYENYATTDVSLALRPGRFGRHQVVSPGRTLREVARSPFSSPWPARSCRRRRSTATRNRSRPTKENSLSGRAGYSPPGLIRNRSGLDVTMAPLVNSPSKRPSTGRHARACSAARKPTSRTIPACGRRSTTASSPKSEEQSQDWACAGNSIRSWPTTR